MHGNVCRGCITKKRNEKFRWLDYWNDLLTKKYGLRRGW